MLTFAALAALLACVAAGGDEREPVRLNVVIGQSPDGQPTAVWLDAARAFNDDGAVAGFAALPLPFTNEENAWVRLIESRLDIWPTMTPELDAPFGDIPAPAEVDVLIGNVGASDAFVAFDTAIGFDVSELEALYGAAGDPVNGDRIDRFFAHEYTHLLHKIWRDERGLVLDSPLDVALWICLTEGLGNYRSLSPRWFSATGDLSDHARKTLQRLEPVFVSRIGALASASEAEAGALLEGISMGPFEDKWGALVTALWLAAEVHEDANALSNWIEQGPDGVLLLARRHLPPDLAGRLPQDRRSRGQ